ncbi:MAG: DNA polymerase III subunit alpha, partial [Acidimicrobiia bacterium]
AEPEVRRVVDAAKQLEGLRRQDSIHAAAVVISPSPLTELVPVQQKGEGAEVVTQYEMHGIEELGLLKMDFLGLRNLSILERTLELIEDTAGRRVDIDSVPLDDHETFRLLQEGESIGVFQLEGGPMRALMRSLRPDRFEDVIALVALYRPGPMGAGMHVLYADRKNARAPVEALHPAVEEVLRDTFGIMVYQEQVMQVAEIMAGYSMAEADNLRKAMGKKIPAVMAAEHHKFVKGCVAKGHPEQLGKDLFALIVHFAGYGFPKAHAAAYGLVAYQTAWLKAHYPAEYLAALLTATKRDKDRTALYLNECRAMKVEVLTPDVNESDMDFTVRDGKIRFGLSAIRNVGEGVVEKIIAARAQEGGFVGFQDFCDRVDPIVLNRRTVESLIKAGAFDGLGHPRKGLVLVFEQVLDAALTRRRNEEMGQFSLFGGENGAAEEHRAPIPAVEWGQKVKLGFEKEMLGLYISDHPLLAVGLALRSLTSTAVPGLWETADGATVTVGGLVGSITRRFTRKGEPMLFFQLEDLEGSVEVVAFPRTVAAVGQLIQEDSVVVVTGRLDHRGDDLKVIVHDLREVHVPGDQSVRLEVPAKAMSTDLVHRLKDILSNHPGTVPVYLHMTHEKGHKVLRLSDDHRVEPRSALYAELRELLGRKAVG